MSRQLGPLFRVFGSQVGRVDRVGQVSQVSQVSLRLLQQQNKLRGFLKGVPRQWLGFFRSSTYLSPAGINKLSSI